MLLPNLPTEKSSGLGRGCTPGIPSTWRGGQSLVQVISGDSGLLLQTSVMQEESQDLVLEQCLQSFFSLTFYIQSINKTNASQLQTCHRYILSSTCISSTLTHHSAFLDSCSTLLASLFHSCPTALLFPQKS